MQELCIYCGERDGITRDHVIPKNLFPNPRPTNLLTVPACCQCNASFSKDEEYFRVCISQLVGTHTHAGSIWLLENKIIPKFTLQPKLATQIQEDLIPIRQDGQVLHGWSYDNPRIKRVIKKIVRGLYFIEKQVRISEEQINFGLFDDDYVANNEGTLKCMQGSQFKVIGNNIFGYTVRFSNINNSFWIMNFFDGITFYAVTVAALP